MVKPRGAGVVCRHQDDLRAMKPAQRGTSFETLPRLPADADALKRYRAAWTIITGLRARTRSQRCARARDLAIG